MLGAIIGDIVGSRWEFNPTNNYNFELFSKQNDFTDDTICTIGVADAILKGIDYGKSIHHWCRKYPNPTGGYGNNFLLWVMSDYPKPYYSWGNGAAMRVSPISWAFPNDYITLMTEAEKTAACSHNHPEGIKGAQAVAIAIHDCKNLHKKYMHIGKTEILVGLNNALQISGYNIKIKKSNVQNKFDNSCQGTIPVAFWIIYNSNEFEDAIRNAVSLGADADTLAAIVGSIAESIWEIPKSIKQEALSFLPSEMLTVVNEFDQRFKTVY